MTASEWNEWWKCQLPDLLFFLSHAFVCLFFFLSFYLSLSLSLPPCEAGDRDHYCHITNIISPIKIEVCAKKHCDDCFGTRFVFFNFISLNFLAWKTLCDPSTSFCRSRKIRGNETKNNKQFVQNMVCRQSSLLLCGSWCAIQQHKMQWMPAVISHLFRVSKLWLVRHDECTWASFRFFRLDFESFRVCKNKEWSTVHSIWVVRCCSWTVPIPTDDTPYSGWRRRCDLCDNINFNKWSTS